MCVEGANYQANPHGDEVERWCERFAAAVLLPWSDVSSFLMEKTGWSPGKQIEDLPIASKVARAFRVSLRAAVIRLVENGAAGWALYRKIPKMIDAKGGGGGSGRVRAQIRLDEYGRRTAALMLRGVDEDVLTRDDANSYLNVRDADLDELRTLTMEP